MAALRDTAVLKDQLIGGGGVLSHLLFFLADDQPGGAAFHQKAADPFPLRRILVGHRPDDKDPGIGGAGDEYLGAVQDVAVTVI